MSGNTFIYGIFWVAFACHVSQVESALNQHWWTDLGACSQSAGELSPVSAVISLKHNNDKQESAAAFTEQSQFNITLDDEDTVMPLPSDRSPDADVETNSSESQVSAVVQLTNRLVSAVRSPDQFFDKVH